MSGMPWDEAIALLRDARRAVITTHVHADGDGLGAELALARFLRAEGKEALIVNPDPLPARYGFLAREGEIACWPASAETVRAADVALVLDISKWERLGPMAAALRAAPGKRICIDHHPFTNGFADLHLIDDAASSTGELVHELLQRMGARLTPDIYEALYVAVLTDTGGFRFTNTTPRCLEIAADAIRAGVRPATIHEILYESFSAARMRLVGRVLGEVHYECGGKIAHFFVSRALLTQTGANDEETEGLVDYPRAVRGVELVIFFLETDDGGTKVSLRSRSDAVDVNAFAKRFGGGGHPRAAGILFDESPDKIREIILDAARTLF